MADLRKKRHTGGGKLHDPGTRFELGILDHHHGIWRKVMMLKTRRREMVLKETHPIFHITATLVHHKSTLISLQVNPTENLFNKETGMC